MKKKLIMILCLILILSAPSPAYYGARPMGMGGAFTAIANDANAAYWNPAGFAMNPGVDITGSTLLNNRNNVIGDNLFASKFCYEAGMSSPFEWILGVGAISAIAIETAQYLGDMGVLKKNWGRNAVKTNREESMSEQVVEKGTEKTSSINPFKIATPKPESSIKNRWVGPFNLNIDFSPHYHSYWSNRRDSEASDTPDQKAQFAFGFTLLNDKNQSLDMDANWYTFSLASGWEERIALGANLNIYDLKIPSINMKGFGAGVDIGAIAKPLSNFSIGLVAKEVLTTDINWQNSASTRYEMLINGGIAIDPIENLTIAADVHNIFNQNNGRQTMHYGAEIRPFNGFALRAGLSDNNKTAGASVAVASLIIDYAYLGGAFDRTQILGATLKF